MTDIDTLESVLERDGEQLRRELPDALDEIEDDLDTATSIASRRS